MANFNKASLLTSLGVLVGGVIVGVGYSLLVRYRFTYWDPIDLDPYEVGVFIYILVVAPLGYSAGIILGLINEQRQTERLRPARSGLVISLILLLFQILFASVSLIAMLVLKVFDILLDAYSHVHF